jgi:DNA-binding CsgD family transcriptional regulator
MGALSHFSRDFQNTSRTRRYFETPPEAQPDFWRIVGDASEAIGQQSFYTGLLEILGNVVDVDRLALMRYSGTGVPDLVSPREICLAVKGPYCSSFYLRDPFYQYWRTVAQPAVKSIGELGAPDLWDSEYAVDFLRGADISDEIAVFLPPLGGASPTLILDRASGRFNSEELASVQRIFPLLTGLHNAHLRAITHELGPSREKPFRLLDRTGKELAANFAWTELAANPASGLHSAVAELAVHNAYRANLSDGRILNKTALSDDFCAAPGGAFEQIETLVDVNSDSLPKCWLAQLTQRERQIVILTLQGHPIVSIAERLGVRRGTIKNHRLRLYQKLDITTERELFLIYMEHMRAPGKSL